MATFWTAFKLLMKYLPAVIEAIQQGRDFIELRIQLRKFDQAVDQAKETKDTSELEDLFSPKSNDSGNSPR